MLDKVIVKGRTTFIGIYELVGTRSSLSPEEIRRVSEYNDIYKLAESVFNNPSMWASNGGTTSRKNSKAHELASIAAANRANIKPFSQLANVPITDISPENIETEPNPNSPTRITFEETGNRIDSQKSIPRQTRTESDYSSSRDLFELSKQTDQSIWNILLNDYQSDRSSSNPNPETIDKEFSNSEEFQESQKMLVYISEAINRASFAFEGESAESMMNSNFSITDENNELDLLSSYSQKRNSETLKREKAIGQAESASFNEEASRKRRERFHSANGQFNEASSFGKLVARMERYVENYPDDKPGQLLLSKILAKTFGVPTKMTEK
ncbi:hypothetical protein HK098_006669 [Nowakowskiella sp. JEL0407]|nr:hypothetical protein HK098_006669 [Nowakowskiella sp. JEL0407]